MKHLIVLIGFGTVAQGLCRILFDKRDQLLELHNFDFEIVGVSTRSRGTMYHPQGLSLSRLLELAMTDAPFHEHLQNWNTENLIKESNATVVVELTHTDLKAGKPAISYCKTAFKAGKHVVTGNKGPATLAYSELRGLADKARCYFLNEATVLSGTPVFSLVQKALAGNKIQGLRGILNGTTNFILSEMEAGISYRQALKMADDRGYLEADKSADLEGHDARAKLVILSNILLNIPLHIKDITCRGITQISSQHINTALQQGKRWKLVASLVIQGTHVIAEVKPEKLPLSDPLAQVSGTDNSIIFSTDLLGDVSIIGPGAGSVETGYSILSDLLTINKGEKS